MGIFRRKVPNHYIPIHPDNVSKKDWVIILEAGTIIGSSPEKTPSCYGNAGKNNCQEIQHFLA